MNLLDALEAAATTAPLKRFLLPDGAVPPPSPAGAPSVDRLLFILEGVKHEPMSLGGELSEVRLETGDAYLIRKNIWEFISVTPAHKLLCIVPRGSFLRTSFYDFPPGVRQGEWCQPEAIHTGRPVPEALLATFAALAVPGNEEGEHIPHLLRAAASIALDECRRPSPPAGKAAATFDRVRAFVDENFFRPMDRVSVAEQFNLNVNYLSELFRQFTNRPFREYVEERRFDMARRLLIQTDFPVKEVAYHCGFPNEVYFIRRFRELHATPPGRYRLSNRSTP